MNCFRPVRVLSLLLLPMLAVSPANAQWTQFRGPNGSGVGADTGYPVEFSPSKNVVWKTAVYFFVAAVLHYLERLYDFWKETPGLLAANQKMLAELVWPHFWAIQILLAVLILMYCVMGELGRASCRERVYGPV